MEGFVSLPSSSSSPPCPELPSSIRVTFLGIIQKVYFECFFWGAGTAIGELPPYFVAKAARLSGKKLEETLEELGDDEEERTDTNPTIMDRLKKLVIGSIGSFGFIRIMLFASIPNPLFDLAGLTCGHLLVPFWTFFGATLIGKAVNKTLIQSVFVLTAFSKDHLEVLIDYIESKMPFLEGILRTFFERQRAQFHLHGPNKPTEAQSWLSLSGLWDIFLMGMISYFLISILESAVQHHLATVDDFKIKTMMNNQPKKSNGNENNTAGNSITSNDDNNYDNDTNNNNNDKSNGEEERMGLSSLYLKNI